MFAQLLAQASRLIFPPYCEWCRCLLAYGGDLLCMRCKKNIRPVVPVKVSLTAKHFMWVYSVGAYEDPLRYLIISKRWGYRLASIYLGQLMWQQGSISMIDFDMVLPVPLHWSRKAWRGYNQAEIMAHEIAKESGKIYINAIERTVRTPFQTLYRGNQREENVHQAFGLRTEFAEQIRGKNILLVDDLITTGSTLRAVAKELLKAQPLKISAIVAARAS